MEEADQDAAEEQWSRGKRQLEVSRAPAPEHFYPKYDSKREFSLAITRID